MAVVFDEVVGEVQSDATPPAREQPSEPAASAPKLEDVRYEIRRLARREERLRAD